LLGDDKGFNILRALSLCVWVFVCVDIRVDVIKELRIIDAD